MLITATRRRLRLLPSLLSGLVLLTLAAGCRSTQPAATAYQVHGTAPTVAAAPTPLPAPTPPPIRPVVAAPVVASAPAPAHTKARAPRRTALPTARTAAPKLTQPRFARAVLRTVHRPLGEQPNTTEVGLGTTVLGVLGLIVGPISLIGLLIWGGPVWAILLGLSALAVLVAYIDPFR